MRNFPLRKNPHTECPPPPPVNVPVPCPVKSYSQKCKSWGFRVLEILMGDAAAKKVRCHKGCPDQKSPEIAPVFTYSKTKYFAGGRVRMRQVDGVGF